jgi:hypothetical protein
LLGILQYHMQPRGQGQRDTYYGRGHQGGEGAAAQYTQAVEKHLEVPEQINPQGGERATPKVCVASGCAACHGYLEGSVSLIN